MKYIYEYVGDLESELNNEDKILRKHIDNNVERVSNEFKCG